MKVWVKTILDIKAEIDQSDDYYLAVGELVSKSGYCRFHLCRAFKAVTGENIGEYLKQRRLNRAIDMIQRGHSVHSAAEFSGYSDRAALFRAFKTHFNMSPRQYINALNEQNNQVEIAE